MKLPSLITNLISPKAESRELFLSLLLNSDFIAAAAWYMDPSGEPHLLSHASAPVAKDSWDHRIEVTDSLLTVVEEKAGSKSAIGKVVLGLPFQYLDENGGISPAVRGHIKSLTEKLDLSPVGFVSVHDAIAYMIKREDGVPASVIFLHVYQDELSVFLYRVGVLVGAKTIPMSEQLTVDVEAVLKEFQDHDVLPSRMVLFGSDTHRTESVKAQLLTYPWTTRANFLHFPKMEILPPDGPIGAVCFAGAKELGNFPAPAPEAEPQEEVAQEAPVQEETNVMEVSARELGFTKDEDILDVPPKTKGITIPSVKIPKVTIPKLAIPNIQKGSVAAGIAVFVGILLWAYWSLPKATVTVLVSPKVIEKSATVIVSPEATAVDAQGNTIPGQGQEQSVTGEKTLPVTGKKNVGDPAKGTVTIYNKVTAVRNLTKGTVLASGSLRFTLDEDVQVASATERIGGKDYGSKSAAITASAIGPQSNLPAGTEFLFQGIDQESLSASNEQALSGGTSREVTVVSRADYDAVEDALVDELVDKANDDLGAGVTGGQKLIDATIQTSVTNRVFAQELDQESTQVSGTITLTVSGLSYHESDLTSLLSGIAGPDVPAGYQLAPSRITVTPKNVQVRSDETVSMPLSFVALALPQVDEAAVRNAIAGKRLDQAHSALAHFEGVVGIDVSFRLSPWKSRLPINGKNISVSVAATE